jgi:hypothetical protein
MRANVDDTAGESFVIHRRHRDQHLAVQIAARWIFLLGQARWWPHAKRLSDDTSFVNESGPIKFHTNQLTKQSRHEAVFGPRSRFGRH